MAASHAKAERTPGLATGLSLLIPITLSTMAIVLLAPILPLIMAAYNDVPNHEYWVPMVLTVPALCVALLSPVAGMLGDYFGRRKLLIWALTIYGVIGILPVFLTDLTHIIISRIGVGITEALIMVLTTTMIGDYFTGAKRDRWLAAQTAVASVSALIFFNLGGFLGSISWRMPFWVYGSALVMLAAVLAFTWEPRKDAAVDDAPRNSSWSAFPWPVFGGILGVTVFASVLFYTVQILASSGLTALESPDPARNGFLTSIASLGVPLGTLIYSRITGMPVARLLMAEFAIMGVGFLLMSKASSIPMFLVGCGINQIGAGLLLPTLLVWAMSQLDFDIRSRGAGLWTGAFSLGQWLSPLVVTFASKQMGGLLPAFSVLGYAALLALGVTIFVAMRKRPSIA
jgi:MFS family permease